MSKREEWDKTLNAASKEPLSTEGEMERLHALTEDDVVNRSWKGDAR